jgi:hypothetical protein
MEATGLEMQRKLEPVGQAFVTFGERGEAASIRISSATARTQADLDNLASRAATFASSMGQDMDVGAQAVFKLAADGAVSLERLGTSFEQVGPDVAALSSSFLGLGPAGLIAAAAIILVTTAAAAALVPVAAFGAGLAATLALGTGLVGGFALLGAGLVALAEHANSWAEAQKNLTTAQAALTVAADAHTKALRSLQEGEAAVANTRVLSQAQILHLQDLQAAVTKTADGLATAQQNVNAAVAASNNPFTTLQQNLDGMAKRLGQQATPAAGELLTFLASLIPGVEKLGSEMITWFGDRLPQILPIARFLFDDILYSITRLGLLLGPIFDKIAKDPAGFEKAFAETAANVVAAVVGLVQNIDSLRKWWEGPGQRTAAQAGIVMDAIGGAMQANIRIIQAIIFVAQQMGNEFSTLGTILHGVAGAIGSAFDAIGRAARGAVGDVQALGRAISNLPGVGGIVNIEQAAVDFVHAQNRQYGGIMVPGGVYRVGETRAETVIQGQQGAMVIPDAGPDTGRTGPTNITININGAGLDAEQVAFAVDRRISRLFK